MSKDWCSELPDERTWRFDEILAAEADRATVLEMAGAPSALLGAMRTEFHAVLAADKVRFAQEQSCSQPQDLRAVVQFPVAPGLFDLFFNARTGYRAHFRAHYECGLRFNAQFIDAFRLDLEAKLPSVVTGRQLNCGFEDLGPVQIARDFLLASLAPDLSKVWFSAKLIKRDGGILDLPPGVVGPRILLSGGETWSAPYRENGEAWLA